MLENHLITADNPVGENDLGVDHPLMQLCMRYGQIRTIDWMHEIWRIRVMMLKKSIMVGCFTAAS